MKYKALMDTSKTLKRDKTQEAIFYAKNEAEAKKYLAKKWKGDTMLKLEIIEP